MPLPDLLTRSRPPRRAYPRRAALIALALALALAPGCASNPLGGGPCNLLHGKLPFRMGLTEAAFDVGMAGVLLPSQAVTLPALLWGCEVWSLATMLLGTFPGAVVGTLLAVPVGLLELPVAALRDRHEEASRPRGNAE